MLQRFNQRRCGCMDGYRSRLCHEGGVSCLQSRGAPRRVFPWIFKHVAQRLLAADPREQTAGNGQAFEKPVCAIEVAGASPPFVPATSPYLF